MIPTRYSLPDPNALTAQLSATYDLGELGCRLHSPAHIRFYSRGANDLYFVANDSSRYFLRISPTGRSPAHIQGEIELLKDLRQNGFLTPNPVATRSGSYTYCLQAAEGQRCVVLFEFIEGVSGYDHLDVEKATTLGTTCARLHQWAEQNQKPYARPSLDSKHLLCQSLHTLTQTQALKTCEINWVETLSNTLKTHIDALAHTKPFYRLCHGDMHPGNAIFNGQQLHLIDFDTSGYGLFAYDLATFRASVDDETIWQGFLTGYSQIRAPQQGELDAIPTLRAARHIWLMAFQAQIGELWGHVWIEERMRDNMRALRQLACSL